jgi:hypothetical protein
MLVELQVSDGAVNVTVTQNLISLQVVLLFESNQLNMVFFVDLENFRAFGGVGENVEVLLLLAMVDGFVPVGRC